LYYIGVRSIEHLYYFVKTPISQFIQDFFTVISPRAAWDIPSLEFVVLDLCGKSISTIIVLNGISRFIRC